MYQMPKIKILFLLFVLIAMPSFAGQLNDVKTISGETLHKMIDDEAAFVLIDARRAEDYAEEHIASAISLPAIDVNAETLAKVEADVHKKLVFYCQNVQCQASHIAAGKAIGAGYQYVYVYSGGIENWKSLGYTVEAAEKIVE